jgi:hypothetical protein
MYSVRACRNPSFLPSVAPHPSGTSSGTGQLSSMSVGVQTCCQSAHNQLRIVDLLVSSLPVWRRGRRQRNRSSWELDVHWIRKSESSESAPCSQSIRSGTTGRGAGTGICQSPTPPCVRNRLNQVDQEELLRRKCRWQCSFYTASVF